MQRSNRLDMTSPCDFCADIGSGVRLGSTGHRPMWLSSSLVVTPTIGPLSSGHLLLLPRQHLKSFGELSRGDVSNALGTIAAIEALLTRRFGATVAFEHGSSGAADAGGCGIDHAHAHFVPVTPRLQGLPPVPSASWRRLGNDWFGDLQELASARLPYVYFKDPRGARYVTAVDTLPSQFVRRWLAEQLGEAEWDWRKSDPEVDFAEARERMAIEIPPAGFSAINELAEVAP